MPVGANQISFDYKHSFKSCGAMGALLLFQPVHWQKNSRAIGFLGTKHGFRGIKCTCINVFWKKGSYFKFKCFISIFCTLDSIIKLSFRGKIDYLNA